MKNERSRHEAVRETDFYKHMFESVRDPILIIHTDGQVIDANNAIVEELGYSKEELVHMTVSDLRSPSEKPKVRDDMEKSYDGYIFETVYMRKDGSLFPVEVSTRGAMLDGERTLFAIIRDVTGRKQLEYTVAARSNELQYALNNLETTLNTIPVGVILAEADTEKILYYSPAARNILGVPVLGNATGPVPGKPLSVWLLRPDRSVIPPDEWPLARALRHGEETKDMEIIVKHVDGNEATTLINCKPVRNSSGKIISAIASVVDITERKRAEKEQEITVDFLKIVNEARSTRELIQSATAFFQQKSGCEAVGIRLREGDDYPYYEARGFRSEFVRKENLLCARDEQGRVLRDKDGFPILDCMCGNVITGRFDASKPFFTQRGSFWTNSTTELLKKTTDKDRLARTRNVCNVEGYESFALISLRTGADRMGVLQLNERRKGHFTLEQITMWERLADYLAVALAKFRAEEALIAAKTQAELYLDLMGHDINNMHQIALGYLEFAREMIPQNDTREEFLQKPIEVLQRSAQLISNVRKMQKLLDRSLPPQIIDVSAMLADVQREYGAVSRKPVTLNVDCQEPCHVRANELLYDVYANLVTNTIKHTGEDADILITPGKVRENGRLYCRVAVEDNGPGIPDKLKPVIFNRLLKGTSNAKGMGLGLYLVKSLTESYNGRVWVEDRIPGDHRSGARFVILLPAVEY